MIVRLNQIDPAAAEAVAGWGAGEPRGGISAIWPAGTFAYQLVVLDRDEEDAALSVEFRQSQMRQLIPKVIGGLSSGLEPIVLRLDGLLAFGELLTVFPYLADGRTCDRYAISATEKLEAGSGPVMTSVRLVSTGRLMSALCSDLQLGLERSVRLRAFAVSGEMVNPLLDINDTDDERWREVLPRTSFMVSTALDLRSLVIWTARLGPTEASQRIMQKLDGSPDT